MRFYVCLKQVPDTESKIKVAADGLSIDPAGIKWVVNPYDEFAIEEAVKTRDANPGSQVHVICVGPKKRTVDAVRTALAMGADEGILVDAPESLDPMTTAQALAKVIQQEGDASLIFAGKIAIDDNAASVPQMVAEILGMPHASVVSKITNGPENIVVERDAEGGAKEVLQLAKPAVIAANKGLNLPRYASLPGIMKAKKKVLKELDLAGLGVTVSSLIKVTAMQMPADKPAVKMIAGDSTQQTSELVRLLRDEAKVL